MCKIILWKQGEAGQFSESKITQSIAAQNRQNLALCRKPSENMYPKFTIGVKGANIMWKKQAFYEHSKFQSIKALTFVLFSAYENPAETQEFPRDQEVNCPPAALASKGICTSLGLNLVHTELLTPQATWLPLTRMPQPLLLYAVCQSHVTCQCQS